MRTNHRIARALRAIVMVLIVLTLAWPQPVQAQGSTPNGPQPPHRIGPPEQGQEVDPVTGQALQMGSVAQETAQAVAPMAVGGPDYYGYSWNDATPYSWIDARSGGTNTGYNNNQCWPNSYTLPFSFKYYENTYNSVFIAPNGYMTFTDGNWCWSQHYVPSERGPKNVVALYWTPLYFTSGSGVYYKSGGTAPNRYFVVEWYQMNGGFSGSTPWGTYTFEAILYENGNIVFQYQAMNYPSSGYYYCGGAGIEDMRGYDGLQTNRCDKIPSPKAITFTRPGPASRVLVYPINYGAFGALGGVASVTLPLKSIGNIGSDIFDLQPSCAWPVTLLNGNTQTPLVDNNSNGLIDTGYVGQGASFPLLVQVQMPAMGNVGLSASCTITVTPAASPAKSRAAQVGAAVPAPFAEVDGTYNDGAMNLSIVEPQSQVNKSYASGSHGFYPAVAETPTGNFVYSWVVSRCGTSCSQQFNEIFYTILDKTGGVVKGVTRLADLGGYPPYAFDDNPAIAVSPDGTIGITFYRLRYNSSYQVNFNMYLARLNPAGTLLGITNLTNSSLFASWGSNGLIETAGPAITATSDNRFTVAWYTYQYTASGLINDIVSGVWSTVGAQVLAPAAITSGTPGYDGYYSVGLAASGTNVVFVYERYLGPDIYYQVRSSAGAPVKGSTNLTNNGNSNYEFRPEVVRLSDGHILVAWETNRIQFAILDSAYNLSAPVQDLDMLSQGGEGLVSLAADQDGHGILSWVDLANANTIYYALVNSAGQILTNSMAMKTSADGHEVNYTGNGITSHAITAPTTNQVDLYLKGLSPFPVLPSTTQTLKVELGNLGAGTASNITVTMTIPPGVSVGMPSPAANCVANTCTWTFTAANLGFMGKGVISIPVSIGDVPTGTAYDLTMTIASPETDPYQANNNLTITVVSGYQTTLPAVMR